MSKLTQAQRSNLPTRDFAIPENREYPIPDEDSAKQALAEAAEDTSAARNRVARAVARRYPDVDTRQAAPVTPLW